MKHVTLLVITFLLVIRAFSQRDSLLIFDTTNQVLDEVIVTGVREPQPYLSLPYAAVTRTGKELSRLQPRSTPEALTGINGVFIQKTNHGGGSPFIRGLTGNQVLLLQDGIRINNATFRYGPNQYLNTIDPFTIYKIEVAKGTGSVQYGTDAIGGVLQVITKDPGFATGKPIHTAALCAKYMSGEMEKTLRAEWGYSGKTSAVQAGVTVKHFGDLIGGDTTGRQSPSGYQEWSYDIKTRLLLRPALQLVIASFFLQQRHVPVFHKVRLENFGINEMDPQQRGLHYARVILNGNAAVARKAELTFFVQHTTEGRLSRKNGSAILRKEKDEVFTTGFTSVIKSQWNKYWSSGSGIELYMDNVRSKRTDVMENMQAIAKRGLYPDNSFSTNLSVFSLHQLLFGKWRADAGIRLNSFSLKIPDTSLGNIYIRPFAVVGNAGLVFLMNPRQSLYASWNSGFRAPNIDDLATLGIVDFRYELPAASLHPERSWHTEIGYKYSSRKMAVSISVYHLRINNIITRIRSAGDTISGYPVYYKTNSDKASVKGAESALTVNLCKKIKVAGALAYTYGQSISQKEPMRRIPPFNGRTAVYYETSQWQLTGECLFAASQKRLAQGDKDDNRIPAGGTPGWTIFNFYTAFTYKKVQLATGIQNILNRDYRIHGSGINGAGRSIWLAFTIKK